MIRSLALALLATVLLVGGLRLLALLAEMDFRVVRVEGELTLRESEQVRAAIAGLDRVAIGSVADVVAVVERLGWVREVRARRHWPDALHVVVRRETPVARWGQKAWLATSGTVIASDQLGAHAPLPTINAARTDGAGAMEIFNRVGTAAAAEGLRVVTLTESRTGDWTATFSDGAQVVLGRTALRERMERFATVYRAHLRPQAGTRQNAPPNAAARADARYPNGVAVRWVAQAHHANPPDPMLAPTALAMTAASSHAPSVHRAPIGGLRDGE